MSFGGIKNYSLIHLDFRNYTYAIYHYQKDRRLTARQAWAFMRDNKPNLVGEMKKGSTVFLYFDLIEEFGLTEKYCDRYCTFKGFD